MLWFSVGATEGPGGVSILCEGSRLVFLLSPENLTALRPALPPAHGGGCLPGSHPHTCPNPPNTQSYWFQIPSHPTPIQRVQQLAQGGDAPSASTSPSSSPPTSYSASPFTHSGCRASSSTEATSTQTALVCPRYPFYNQN